MSEEQPREVLEEGPLPTIDVSEIPQSESPPRPESEGDAGPGDETESEEVDDLVAEAEKYGFTEEDIEGLGREKLTAFLDKAEARAFARFKELTSQEPSEPQHWQSPQQRSPAEGPPGPMGGPVTGWPQQTGGPPQAAEQPQTIEPYRIGLSADEYDDGLIAELNKMNEHYQGQLSRITSSLQQAEQLITQQVNEVQYREHLDHTAWFDKHVAALGDDYESVFGKGLITDHPNGSQIQQERNKAYAEYLQWLSYHGHPPTTKNDELFAKFMRVNYGDVLQSSSRKKLSDELKRRSKRTIGKPSGRKRSLSDTNRDPQTGMPVSDIQDMQRMINEMLQP